MITMMFYQTMLANKCLNITSYCVCVQQPHPECWLAQQKYRTISHYVEIQRNSNLEFSITWLTQLWSMCGCCNGRCVPRKSKCNESQGIQNRFHKSLCKLGTQSALRHTAVFWHNWRSNKDIPYVQTHPGGHWQLWKDKWTKCKYPAHTRFHVININWILASNEQKLFKKFHFN